MAQTVGQIGFGTTFGIGDGASPEVFTLIGELFAVSPVGAEKPLVDFTHHTSPNTFKEWLTGVADGTEITLSANFVASDAGQILVRTTFNGILAVNMEVTGPSGAQAETAAFAGIITAHDVDRPLEDRQVFNFTVKVAGSITYS